MSTNLFDIQFNSVQFDTILFLIDFSFYHFHFPYELRVYLKDNSLFPFISFPFYSIYIVLINIINTMYDKF